MASQVGYIDSADGAEENAAVRMRDLGFLDARTTGLGSDGGIDVISSQALGQVKWQGAQVGRPELQQFYGARGSRYDQALLFFSATGYSRQALAYADDNYIATFTYDPLGRLTATNSHASAVVTKSEAEKVAAKQRQASAASSALQGPVKPVEQPSSRPPAADEDGCAVYLGSLIALFFSTISSGTGLGVLFNLEPGQEWNLAATLFLGVSLLIVLISGGTLAAAIRKDFKKNKKGR